MTLQVQELNESFSVSGQISPQDVPAIAAAGYKSIINNRPDYEGGPDQPSSEEVAGAAQAANLQYYYLPVVSGQWGEQQVREMAQILQSAAQPIFCYCRSGARSAQLYAQAMQLK